MRFVLLLIVFLSISFQPLNAQSDWFSVDTNKRAQDKVLIQVINVVNPETNELVVFFRYRAFIIANIYNINGKIVNTFRVEALPKHKHNYFGTSINGNIYTLFFQNDYGTKFSALTLNFDTSAFEFSDKIEIPLKSETVVATFEYNSKIHLLTTLKRSSKLKIYQLQDFENFTVETFDFSTIDFVTYRGFDTNLNEILKGPNADPRATMINHGEPTSLEMVTQHNKIYLDKDKLILTSDIDDLFTNVISISLDTKDKAYHKFPKPSYDKKDRGSKSNSYVLDHHLFNMYISKEKLDFSVFDMDTKDLVKNIVLSDKDSIAFKNSPIILEGGDFQSYRELDRTKQFMRKVTNSNPGISVYKNSGKYVMTLGSSETTTTSPFMVYYAGGAIGGMVAGITSSILTTNFLTYTKTKSTRIECLFDNNLNSLEGSIPENNFNIINAYTESKPDIKFEFKSILKINNNYVLGYFDKDSGLYKYLNF